MPIQILIKLTKIKEEKMLKVINNIQGNHPKVKLFRPEESGRIYLR